MRVKETALAKCFIKETNCPSLQNQESIGK